MSDATLFHSFFDHLPGMAFQMHLTDKDELHFNYVSPGSAAVLDISSLELMQNPQLMLAGIHAEDQQKFLSTMRGALSNLSPWNWEGRVVLPGNKEVKWVNLRATCRNDVKHGTLLEGFMVNITMNKQNELEIVQAHQQLRELSSYIENFKEEERIRIAREIHDDIGVLLTALKMDLAWLTQHLPRDKEILHEKSRAMSGLLDTAINTVNNLIHTLRPSVLDHLGGIAAIEIEAREFTKRTGIVCTVMESPGDLVLSIEQSTTLFRACQEILNNIMERSGAHKVTIRLRKNESCVSLTASDDGKGYDEAAHIKQRNLGLRMVQLRISHLNGCLRVDSDRDQGVSITVSLPLNSETCIDCEDFQPTLF